MSLKKLFDSYKVTLDINVSKERAAQIHDRIREMDGVVSAIFNKEAGEIYIDAVTGSHPDEHIRKMRGVEKVTLNI